MDKRKMLGPTEVESIFSVPVGTLANWRSAKRGPKFYKINRKVLYRMEDLEDFFTATPILTVDSVKAAQDRR